MACVYTPVDFAMMRGLLAFIDCQAQTLGQQGFLALAAPGSIGSLILTALLTILIALFGLRLLLGHVPSLGDGVLTMVKIGIVVALATGWTSYRTLFYDVAIYGPAQLATTIGVPAGLPGASGDLVARLEGVDQQFRSLAIAGSGGTVTDFTPPPLFGGFETFALGGVRVVFLMGAVGAFAGTRVLAGLLLALGPIFIALLLFDGTRGLFEGWLRVLAGSALGALTTTIVLGIEVSVLEPWLAELLVRRASNQSIPEAPGQLLAVSFVFGIMLVVVLAGAARVAWGFRLASRWSTGSWGEPASAGAISRASTAGLERRHGQVSDDRSRAVAVADAISAAERRETGRSLAAPAGSGASSPAILAVRAPEGRGSVGASASSRRTGTRVSASARRRDTLR